MENWTEYSKFFVTLLVIIDPFASIPLMLLLTRGYTHRERISFCNAAALTVAVILLFTAIAGDTLLETMGTSLASFRVGGGIVLLLMALAMLSGEQKDLPMIEDDAEESAHKSSVAVVPLAIPLLAGPGAISTVIIEMHRSNAQFHWLGVFGIILAVASLLWVVLWLAVPIGRRLGTIGLNIINRLFGMILVAIAVEIMASGLRQLFPILAGS